MLFERMGLQMKLSRLQTKLMMLNNSIYQKARSKRGMELVQVAILVAIAVALGLIFRDRITTFVNKTFEGLNNFNVD